MGVLLAVDPGLRKVGCALFRDGALERAWLVQRPREEGHDRDFAAWQRTAQDVLDSLGDVRPDSLVVELMEARGPEVDSRKFDDLMQLVGVASYLAGCLGCPVHGVRPTNLSTSQGVVRGWKGSVPKAVHHRRLLRNVLSAAEVERLPIDVPRYIAQCEALRRGERDSMPSGHDVIDAVGLGVWGVGRALRP